MKIHSCLVLWWASPLSNLNARSSLILRQGSFLTVVLARWALWCSPMAVAGCSCWACSNGHIWVVAWGQKARKSSSKQHPFGDRVFQLSGPALPLRNFGHPEQMVWECSVPLKRPSSGNMASSRSEHSRGGVFTCLWVDLPGVLSD